jgi:hypothetical protein
MIRRIAGKFVARMFPKLTSLEEAGRVVADVTARYEALAGTTAAGRTPPASSSVRSAA